MDNLDEVIRERRSTRMFLPEQAVAREVIEEALDLAIRAPSNSNIQPWHAHLRPDPGAQVYGSMGIARDDAEARRIAVLRNWEFFRALLAGIVCIDRKLGPIDCLGVGMFLQTLLLALTARGLGTCVQVSIAGYPEIVREQLSIPAQFTILCGLAVGHADPDFPANKLRIGRNPLERNVVFVDS